MHQAVLTKRQQTNLSNVQQQCAPNKYVNILIKNWLNDYIVEQYTHQVKLCQQINDLLDQNHIMIKTVKSSAVSPLLVSYLVKASQGLF